MAYYAWSKFETERNEAGIATEFIMPGDTVTKDKLGVRDDEWDYLLETGAVREQEYPDLPDDVAPAEAARRGFPFGQSIVEAATHEVTSGELRNLAGYSEPNEAQMKQAAGDNPVMSREDAAAANEEARAKEAKAAQKADNK